MNRWHLAWSRRARRQSTTTLLFGLSIVPRVQDRYSQVETRWPEGLNFWVDSLRLSRVAAGDSPRVFDAPVPNSTFHHHPLFAMSQTDSLTVFQPDLFTGKVLFCTGGESCQLPSFRHCLLTRCRPWWDMLWHRRDYDATWSRRRDRGPRVSHWLKAGADDQCKRVGAKCETVGEDDGEEMPRRSGRRA